MSGLRPRYRRFELLESFDDIINVSYRQDLPRTPPKPITKSPGDHRAHYSPSRQSKTASFSRIDDLSSIHKPSTETEFSDKDEPVLPVPEVDLEPRTGLGSRSKVQQHKKRTPVKKKKAPSRGRTPKKDRNTDSQKPTCKKHFQQRERFYGLAQVYWPILPKIRYRAVIQTTLTTNTRLFQNKNKTDNKTVTNNDE
ncbi:Hypothetical predicted protein [Mytilus galloprovincialis]|uniref:Uncharacterized protein n=1 Tax=Mytilus galloprovincialis TaxID=29158 RepID=A0A8B6GEX5_MYTGA|nr:Hypothetical predicted protein [Mytilus galloprovincialis]